jgi:cell division protein FtsW (lipid II flippase)
MNGRLQKKFHMPKDQIAVIVLSVLSAIAVIYFEKRKQKKRRNWYKLYYCFCFLFTGAWYIAFASHNDVGWVFMALIPVMYLCGRYLRKLNQRYSS